MDYLPFPRFSSEKLAIWFAQVESVFKLNGIISDNDKYDYIVAHLPLEYSSLVEDILLNPPSESRYDHIKYEYIKRMSIYRLKNEVLGDEKPSEYLQRLRKMADRRVPIEIILNIWLKNLPKPVREIVSLETSGHVDTIGPMADKAMALVLPVPEQCHVQLTSDQFEVLLHRIDELGKQVRVVQLMLDSEGIDEQRRQHGDSYEEKVGNLNRPGLPKVVCWYHTVYGDKATACISPCHYSPPATQRV